MWEGLWLNSVFQNRFWEIKKGRALTGSHVAYGLFVLICCWAGAQMLSMLIHAPGVFERLMQAQDASRPQVDISLAVGTLFGLIPFLIGCTFIGVLALIVRWRQRR
ncbi:Putative inner membrane protein [Klebsiella pneumoniae IS43]|uniref:Inner membrane protein n=1 Tax=Klebsiella pneumoniae IS43 TaxID=1432552 RepID=W1DHW5_KLEPN|nr:Putative inner membrane protein [Klebsiella pneumoniae IS43]